MAARELRILMVCPQFFPTVGGYERAALRLSAKLVARGHQVTVLTERRQRTWPRRDLVEGADVVRLPVIVRRGLHGLTGGLSLAFSLLVRTRRADVVHAHQPGWWAAIAIVVGGLFRTPVVVKVTNTGSRGTAAVLSSSSFATLSRRLHRMADAWLSVSAQGCAELRSLGIPEDRIHEIPNGIDVHAHYPRSMADKREKRTGLGVDTPWLVAFVGRLTEQKDPLLLVDAWPDVVNKNEGATLVFLGDGPLREAIRGRARELGVDASVVVAGQVDNPIDWIAASDIFVLSSQWEGLSNSLLEALACGVPVVSTRVSGSEDVFEKADVGELVPVSSRDELAQAIGRLLGDSERRVICGARARELAEAQYSLGSVVARVETLYLELASHAG